MLPWTASYSCSIPLKNQRFWLSVYFLTKLPATLLHLDEVKWLIREAITSHINVLYSAGEPVPPALTVAWTVEVDPPITGES
jgi:hypothetical protein